LAVARGGTGVTTSTGTGAVVLGTSPTFTTQITVPAITGHVLTGVRLAIGVLWIVLVPCEMLGVTAGLGYFILDTRDRLDYPALMATIVLIGVLGFLLDGFFRTICQLRKTA
jgi:NitT/TauT family transport system permease protein